MDTRNIAAAAAVAVIVGGGALGAASLANAADPTPTPTAAPTTSAAPTTTEGPGMGNGHGKGMGNGQGKGMGLMKGGLVHGEAAKAVAEKLGVDETTFTDAVKAVAEEMRGTYAGKGASGTRPDPEALKDEALTSLASKLGVDKAALTSAIDEALTAQRATENAEHRDEMKTRLDAAVKAGTITQADEDSILKAYDAGVIGGHR